MEFVDNHKTKDTTSYWSMLSDWQRRFIYLGMIIGMLMSGLGIAFLSMKYSIIAACVMVAIGVVVLITTSILWLVWLHHIRKNQLS